MVDGSMINEGTEDRVADAEAVTVSILRVTVVLGIGAGFVGFVNLGMVVVVLTGKSMGGGNGGIMRRDNNDGDPRGVITVVREEVNTGLLKHIYRIVELYIYSLSIAITTYTFGHHSNSGQNPATGRSWSCGVWDS